MKEKILKNLLLGGIIGFPIGAILGYITSHPVPAFSEIVSVRTVDGVRHYNFIFSKMFWDKTEKTVCYGNCRNYSSSSSRGSSSRGGGK